MRNATLHETRLLQRAVSRLREVLPAGWYADLEESSRTSATADGILTIQTPRGPRFAFVIEAKLRIASTAMVEQAMARHSEPLPTVLIAEYVTDPARRRCEDAGMSYLDTTGWAYLRDDHGLLLTRQGAQRPPADPSVKRNRIERLDGPGASRVIRALWNARGRVGVREVAAMAMTTPGTVAKVLPALERYGAITRDAAGGVEHVHPRLLIERWIQDYRFRATNPAQAWYLSPRGLPPVFNALTGSEDELTVTGYHGAVRYLPPAIVPVVPERELIAYTPDPEGIAKRLNLRPAAPGAGNVLLVLPRDASLVTDGPGFAPLPQVIADLLTMDGRYPELGAQVFETVTDTPWER